MITLAQLKEVIKAKGYTHEINPVIIHSERDFVDGEMKMVYHYSDWQMEIGYFGGKGTWHWFTFDAERGEDQDLMFKQSYSQITGRVKKSWTQNYNVANGLLKIWNKLQEVK